MARTLANLAFAFVFCCLEIRSLVSPGCLPPQTHVAKDSLYPLRGGIADLCCHAQFPGHWGLHVGFAHVLYQLDYKPSPNAVSISVHSHLSEVMSAGGQEEDSSGGNRSRPAVGSWHRCPEAHRWRADPASVPEGGGFSAVRAEWNRTSPTMCLAS